jgi:hypothetical protein
MLAMQYFTRSCVSGIEQYWLPFWHFRTFWTYELSPKHIINSNVGNRAFVSHRISTTVTVEEVEEALGIENLRKQIMPMHSFSESIAISHVADAVLNGELSVVEVGMVLAHRVAQEIF